MHLQRTTAALFALLVVHGQPAVVVSRRSRWRPSCTASSLPMRVPAAAQPLGITHGASARTSCLSRAPSRSGFRSISPRFSCRARRAREALVAAQEPLIEEGGPVPRNTTAALPRRRAAPPSTAGGSLVDPRPSRPSPSMYRRLGDGSCSRAMADALAVPGVGRSLGRID